MAEVIAELDYQIQDESGGEYFVNVIGEQIETDKWEAWLEFVPLDDSALRITPTETNQTTRADVVRWASALTETFIQGAFARAVEAGKASGTRAVATPLYPSKYVRTSAALDPFAIFALGEDALRLQLRSFTRAELLAIIDAHALNPAQLSLARLSDSQLVTFIITAVDAQIHQGRRSD